MEYGIKIFLALVVLSVCPVFAAAAVVTVNVGDLTEALSDARREPDAVTRLVLEAIQAQLDTSAIMLADGELIYSDTITNQVVEDGCTNTTLQHVSTDISLTANTGLVLEFESLFDPLVIALDLSARLQASGRAKQNFGVRLGSCVGLASDTFDFTAQGPLRLQLKLSVSLHPRWIDEQTLQVQPVVTIEGQLREGRIVVDVDDSLIRGLIEDFLQSEVDDLLGPNAIQQEIDNLQQEIDAQLRQALDGASDGTLNLELPSASDEQIAALYELLTPQARFPLTESFIETYRLPLIAALISDNQDEINDILQSALECQLGGVLQTQLGRAPVYTLESGACEAVSELNSNGTYYSNSNCDVPFSFVHTDLAGYCETALDSRRLGNAMSESSAIEKWTLSPGTTFELGVLSLAGKKQPFTQRVQYKSVGTAAGDCALEMRIYASSPAAIGQRSLVALHGGSWQRRGSGFLGVEHMATHFVDAGFVVFAPFYRLIGAADGVAACQNANLAEIVIDTNDAFDWVLANQRKFGAAGKPVVFGQSAGGHLALSLAVQHSDKIAAAALFYAPTDFADFANQYRQGEYDNPQGQRIIEAVTGSSLEAIDTTSALIQQNSFPAIIESDPDIYPPMFMLHGESDSLLPARQSMRLCNGLAGDAEQGPATIADSMVVARTIVCDSKGSELHLVAEGEHTLDLCISPELCLAGSPASAAVTGDLVERMLKWVKDPVGPQSDASGQGGGGGLGISWILWAFFGLEICVKKMKQIVSI